MYETITPQTPYLVLKLLHLCVKVRLLAMPVQSVDHLVYRVFSLKTIQSKGGRSTWDHLGEKTTVSTGLNQYYLRSFPMGFANQ